jgi:predicted RNA-binding Zn-ribbon protein involved in translation (DUF1610 family)
MSSVRPPAPDTVDGPPKSLLICPACGHESPVGGDWHVETHDAARVTLCPDCGAEIERRPA